jgi:type VI secretion system protein ImpL
VLWILSTLVALIAWALWFVLRLALYPDLGIWIPVVATVGVAVFLVVFFIVRRIRAGRAAKALEQAIAQQGAQQALNARPERRAEIQELQKQVLSGISALKSSRLGGNARGAAALYQLPWYVIIGPPGAGKTTALKHSGLVFPYANPSSGGGVRGVGGTRNCDWWFTNEAILLDTAGRYSTEQDDHQEWIAFLQMLKRYRARRPINGILIAVSITDLIDANEQQIEAMGKKLRARVDEVMTQLHMVVPVYLLFTKVDLVAGFNEFFNDLRKSDRAQAWGATFRLDAPKTEPGKLFDAEFDILVKQLHGRALKRLATERIRESREKIYQFPLEFTGLKRNLSDLVSTMFMVNAFQGTPIFRGFYFTSGTQEGRPLDRVLGRMGQAMGIRPPEAAVQAPLESKSYFLYDVFMNVVFPDGDLAARSASEIRRQALMRVAVSAAALLLGVIVAIPGVVSFFNNRNFLLETEERAKAAAAVTWNDGKPAGGKLEALQPLLERLQEIDAYRENGVPFKMSWFMYRGEDVYRSTVAVYVASLQQGFGVPARTRLEERLKVAKGDPYIRERTDLKTYLMLSDIEHLDVDWATGRFVALWAESLRSTSNMGESELKKLLTPHVRHYFTLLKAKKVTPLPTSPELVERVRKVLLSVPVRRRYYDLFVNVIIDEKYDEAGDATRANKKYPPLTLADLFVDRPDVLKVLTSKKLKDTKIWAEVEGPYTEKGHFVVASNIADAVKYLEDEGWVVPLTPEEKGDRVAANIKNLASDYEEKYKQVWTDWLKDITVSQPATVKQAIELYKVLTTPDWPYLRILRAVEDHTQWKRGSSVVNEGAAAKLANQQLSQKATQMTGFRLNIDVRKIGDRVSEVPDTFKRLIEFGVPQEKAGGTNAPITNTPLQKYTNVLEGLRNEMQKVEDATPNVDARVLQERIVDAYKQTDAEVQPFDDKAKEVLSPWLLTPYRLNGVLIPAQSRFAVFNKKPLGR